MSTKFFIKNKFKLDEPAIIEYNRKKEDYIKISPTTGTIDRLNKSGNISFEVNNQESFLYLPESFLYCEFQIYVPDAADKSKMNEIKKDITLENNFFPKLFSSIRLQVGTQTIEEIIEPGDHDDLLKFIVEPYSKTKTSLQIQG